MSPAAWPFMKKLFLTAVALAALSGQCKAIDFDDDAIEVGYRGFAEFGYTLGVGDGSDLDRINLLTSHGYQIIPQFFVGAGAGVNYYYDSESWSVPIFAHLRSDFLDSDITPFAEVRVGYSVADVKGFYLNPAIGCRFSVSDNLALNVSVGYTMQKHSLEDTHYGYGYLWESTKKLNIGGIDFRIGLDF